MKLGNSLFSSVKIQKFFIAITVSVSLFIFYIFFLSAVNLFNVVKSDEKDENVNASEKLIYDFKPNTIAIDYEKLDDLSNVSDEDADIKEQFLSYGISYGIDVSEWQGDIDWKMVSKTGISFAIIRCGYRYIESNKMGEDAKFRDNIKGAMDAGLRVGVYFYGTATTKEEAIEEAEYTIKLIKDYNLSYPVVYDAETFDRGRMIGVSDEEITDNIIAYMDTIESYGYASMVYSNGSAFYSRLDTAKFDSRLLWLAHYIDKTDYKGSYNMWQYTSEGKVSGISGNVDLNISYFKYVDKPSDIVKIPEKNNVETINFEIRDEEVELIKSSSLRATANLDMPNKISTLKAGDKLQRIGYTNKISKVLFNNRVAYIESSALKKTE